MRHLSQQIREVLQDGDQVCEQVIQLFFTEFKVVRMGKFKQEFSEVLSEFKEIATNALLFGDGHLDSCMENLQKEEIKELEDKLSVKKLDMEDFETKSSVGEENTKKDLKEDAKGKLENAKISIQAAKLQIKKMKNFVTSGSFASSASSR